MPANIRLIISTLYVVVAVVLPAAGQGTRGQTAALAHLEQAAALLDRIPLEKVQQADEAEEEFAALRKSFAEMLEAYRATGGVPPPIDTSRARTNGDDEDAERGPIDWREKFSEVERKLTALVGGGPAFDGTVEAGAQTPVTIPNGGSGLPAPTGTVGTAGAQGATGTSGTVNPGQAGATDAASQSGVALGRVAAEVSTIGIEDLDPAVRQQLHEFRRELELFFIATIGV